MGKKYGEGKDLDGNGERTQSSRNSIDEDSRKNE